jgi:dihydropteroate synthase
MKPIKIGSEIFNWGSRTYVMGILNITPDSFSGDGIMAKGDAVQAAIEQAGEFLSAGADILDIGGESTRPGSTPVEAGDEIRRVVPVMMPCRAVPGVPSRSTPARQRWPERLSWRAL